MNVEVAIIDTSERGVQVALGEGAPFWIPRSAPGVVWSTRPEVGDVVYVRVPAWLAGKHKQLQALRFQRSLSLHDPLPGLNPAKADKEGSFPMAYDNDMSGALFKNDRKEKPSHPDYQGKAEIHGRKFWISAWIKTSEKDGRKYMSLAFKPVEEKPERQEQRPAAGPTFGDDDAIPFMPDR